METLTKQRAALEALATTVESIEEDARIATRELRSAGSTAKTFMTALSDREADESLPEDVKDRPLVVMLASSSRWRRALIAQILPPDMVLAEDFISPDIDEKAIRRENPEDMVKAIAHAKADKTLSLIESRKTKDGPPDIIICADQVVCYGEQVREKPLTKEQAKEHLQSYGRYNQPARCITGVVVACPALAGRFEGTDISLQYFNPVPDKVADALIAKGDVMFCAGSFVVEDPLLAPYLGERSGELESVQGMPKELTQKLIMDAAAALRKQNQPTASKRNKRT